MFNLPPPMGVVVFSFRPYGTPFQYDSRGSYIQLRIIYVLPPDSAAGRFVNAKEAYLREKRGNPNLLEYPPSSVPTMM